MSEQDASTRRNSTLVAVGILLSRLSGLVRQRAFGHVFGTGMLADAFTAAFRIPNLMQNLLGEGVLSASFIPVYARLVDEGRREEAGRVAGAVAGMLAAVAGAITLLAVVFAGPLTSLLAPGLTGQTREITVTLVRIITPGIGFLVLSAWCLGVLNSHRRFFLSYVAPVIWNVVQIVVLVGATIWLLDDPLRPDTASTDQLESVLRILGVGTLLGGLAQLLVQVPSVRRLEPGLRPSLRHDLPGVRQVRSAFGAVVAGRGVVQLSAYLDLFLASLLATGAVSALLYAQVLYLLPISLFGMSVAAAELPVLSVADREDRLGFARRMDTGLARMAFYVLFCVIAFTVTGDLVVGALFRSGDFGRDSEVLVWAVLAAFAVGLLASTSSRLLQSALYGVDDARTPARAAAVRVAIATAVGVLLMFQLDRFGYVDGEVAQLGDLPAFGPLPAEIRASPGVRLGAVGLGVGAAVGAWYEFRRLRQAIRERFATALQVGGDRRGHLVLPAAAALAVGVLGRVLLGEWPRLVGGPLAVLAMGLVYVGVATRTRVVEAHVLLAALRRHARPLADVRRIRRGQRRRRR